MGLLVVAAAAAGGWAAPRDPWLMLAIGGPMAVGAGAALLGGLRCAAAELTGARFIGVALVGTTVVGSLLAVPLTWALAGNVPDSTEEARAAVRVFMGLTFALVVLAAAYSATLARHLREGGQAPLRRVTSETDVTIA